MKARGSIRQRLFFQLAGVAALLSVTFFLAVRGVAERAAEGTQDDILAASAIAIADSLRSEDGGITLDLPYSALSMLGTVGEDRVFYRVSVAGRTLTGYDDLPTALRGNRPELADFDTRRYRGDLVRIVSMSRQIGAPADYARAIVTVAQTRQGMDAISGRITAIATGIGMAFFLLATALSLWAAGSALAPIDRVAGAVARRGPSDLRPVTQEIPAELLPLVDALNNFMTRLRASLSRTEDFIAEAAHRVRTPLATVRAQAEITHRKLDKPEHRHAVREMIRAIDESSRSAGQMLDHAMVTFRAESLAREELDLRVVLDEAIDRLGPTADLRDITLRRDMPEGRFAMRGDEILLQAALMNVLDNAIKYSPEDSEIVIRLARLSDEEGAGFRTSVIDRGRGFGDADMARLTNRYQRGSNVGNIVGSGLGLTIANDVARAHGGSLEISQNQEGTGACVSLVLPQ